MKKAEQIEMAKALWKLSTMAAQLASGQDENEPASIIQTATDAMAIKLAAELGLNFGDVVDQTQLDAVISREDADKMMADAWM